MHEELDFINESPLQLFKKICIPTTIAMLISAVYVIADGIFIGRGLGQNGLAAINIIVPLFTVFTGISMLLGFGASTLCAIELSRNEHKKSTDIFSQTLLFSVALMMIITLIVFLFSEQICSLLGANAVILDMSNTYLKTMILFSVFFMLSLMLSFFIRLDGAPKYAMICSIIGGITNIVLDYIFIFPLQMGVFGAAFATGLGNMIATILMLFYLVKQSKTLRFSFQTVTAQVVIKASHIGFPGLLTELCLSVVTFSYNIVLMDMFSETGVSAYSIINYIHPLMLLVFMGISQSMQPIISYNYGANLFTRVKNTLNITLITAMCFGLIAVTAGFTLNHQIISVFLNSSYKAFDMAVHGLPLFFLGYIFLGFNMIGVSYFQSIEKPNIATLITILRGVVFVIILLMTLPKFLGINGIWLAVPISEALGGIITTGVFAYEKMQSNKQS